MCARTAHVDITVCAQITNIDVTMCARAADEMAASLRPSNPRLRVQSFPGRKWTFGQQQQRHAAAETDMAGGDKEPHKSEGWDRTWLRNGTGMMTRTGRGQTRHVPVLGRRERHVPTGELLPPLTTVLERSFCPVVGGTHLLECDYLVSQISPRTSHAATVFRADGHTDRSRASHRSISRTRAPPACRHTRCA